MSLFINQSFGSVYVNITSYGWTRLASATGNVTDGPNRAVFSGSNGSVTPYFHNTSPGDPNQRVRITMFTSSSLNNTGMMLVAILRGTEAPDNWYEAGFIGPNWAITKVVNGVRTEKASVHGPWSGTTMPEFQTPVFDATIDASNTIRLFINNSETPLLTWQDTDTPFTGTGKVGAVWNFETISMNNPYQAYDSYTYVPPAPTINTHPADQTVNEGSPVTFSVTATASAGSLTYQWKRAEAADLGTYAPVSGATSSSYTISSTDCIADSGINVICTVGDDNSSIDSSAASLYVRSVTTTVPPSYDIDTGGWTTSSGVEYFALIDESVPSDADYITSPTITSTPAPIDLELKYPLNTGTWNVFVRTKTSSGTATLRVHLLNASNTIVGTSADQAITSTYTTYELPVTISEPASIVRTEVVV